MSRVQKFLLFLVLIVLFYNFIKGKEVAHADAYASGDVSCVANGVIDYVNGFFTAAPAYQHIKFITPVFNVGEPNFNALITQIINGTGANWNKFDFEGANAYDTADGKLVMAYVNESYDKYALNKPMILTETGWHDYYAGAVSRDVAKTKLAGQISAIGGDSRIQAALLFNALGTGSSEWDAFRLSTSGPDEFAEIGANNGKIGANSASHYTSGDGFYSTANQKGLKYTLEIANDDQVGVLAGVKSAHNNAMIPIIRIGYGDPSSSTSGGFDDPAHYAAFLKYIDDNVGSDPEQTVYAIIGPNEPNAERWASHGACNDSSYSGGNGTIKIRGQVRTSKNIVLPTGARVTGGYVQGVKVVAYEGVSPTISETCKDNGDLKNLSHNLGGGINISTTDRFGYFELTLNRDSGCNKTNYLIFYAGASANPADNLIDMWKVPTTDNYEPLRINVNVDVSVKNDADGPYFSIDTPSDPPDPYNYLNRADILSCYTPAMGMTPTIYEALKKTFIVSKGITTRLGLKFDDHSYDNTGNPGSDVPLEGDDRTTSIPLYGREDQTNESVSIANLIATTTCTIWGCVAPIVMPRYDKKFPVQEISQCSDYQQSTSPVPVEGSNSPINSRYYGPAVNLSDPNVVTSAKLSSVGKYYLANYATQLKCMAVCKDSSVTSQDECYNAASGLPATGVVYMHNIQPPWFKDPEVVSLTGVNPDCLVGSGGCYLKDVSYFPYALVTGTRFFGEGQGETTTNSDSFNSPARRDKQFPDDPSTSKELTLSESDGTDKAFTSGPTAVIYQGTNGDASPIPASTAVNNKVLNINGVDEIIAPPTDVISDPKFGDQPDPAQGAPSIQKKYSLRSAGNGGLVRIGRPDNLCVKSNFDAQEGTRIFNLWGLGADPSPDHQPYTAGYSFVTSKNILSIGCDSSSNQFFCWPVDLLTAVIQAITSFFTTGWTTHTNNTAGKTCGGFNHTPSDNECASGDINCSCLNGVITEDPQTLRLSCSDPNGWHKTQVWIQQYTCSGVVQTKPFIVDNKLPLPIKGLATGMQNFCLAPGTGPDDDNTGALAGGSIDVNATNQASFK
ncbi:MAG TPA: hypothetical protein VLI92_00145, partial [Candidatus Saccharimonadales bacterium]|nr:hypothetical protein [Candidatus Saccharimonadales bacterium]